MTTTTMTRRATTVEEAIEAALRTLEVSREEVKVEIIHQGRKGFFGIGSKEAEVRVTVIEVIKPTSPQEDKTKIELNEEKQVDSVEKSVEIADVVSISTEKQTELDAILKTEQYLEEISRDMGIDDLDISYAVDGKYVRFQLESLKAALLIGKRGQTLNALQQLAQLVTNKYSNQFKVVRVDVGDYRDRREQSLQQLAERMADKAVRTSRRVQLEPMPAYERKVIHHALSSRLDIETHSEGADPYRYLVIEAIR